MNSYSFAVCGFGRIGKRHARISSDYDYSSLTAVIDVNTDRRSESSDLYADTPVFDHIEAFIEHDQNKTDVVTIATPNGLHAEIAVKCLNAGYHVVIEKPMALSKADCEKVIFASEEANKQVFVVKQNRYSPTSKWLKEIVDSGTIGDIYQVQVNCFWNRNDRYYTADSWHGNLELDGGTLFTQFSHFVDIMYWVFGDIEDIHSVFEDFNHDKLTDFEDSGIVQFKFKKGGMGSLNFSTSCWNQNLESSITLIGSKGSCKVGGQYMNEVVYCHIEDYEMPELEETNPPNDYGPYKGSAANHHYVFENVVSVLNGKSEITANAHEGMKVVDIIERMYKFRVL